MLWKVFFPLDVTYILFQVLNGVFNAKFSVVLLISWSLYAHNLYIWTVVRILMISCFISKLKYTLGHLEMGADGHLHTIL